jgi:hypothetical protein
MAKSSGDFIQYPSLKKDRMSNYAVVGLLGLLFTGVAVDRMIETGFEPASVLDPKLSQVSKEALKKVKRVSTSTFIIREGVKLRSAPEINYGTSEMPENTLNKVQPGTEVVVRQPVLEKGFIGFSLTENKASSTHSLRNRADEMRWVAASELMQYEPDRIAEIKAPVGNPPVLKAHVGSHGVIKLTHAGEQSMPDTTHIAQATIQSAGHYEHSLKEHQQ